MSAVTAPARYSDGRSAAAHDVEAAVDDITVSVFHGNGTSIESWPLDAVRIISGPDQDGTVRLCRAGGDARLTTGDPSFVAAVQTRCPKLRAGAYTGAVPWQRTALWVVAAVASVAVFFFVLVPLFARQAVALIPPHLEARAGKATSDLLIAKVGEQASTRGEKLICDAPAGVQSLRQITARLTEVAAPPYDIQVSIINIPVINAFALPGGQILVFRGLVDFAEDPNELAGVLAHEFGHVEQRHPLQIAIERSSGAFVVGLLLGDVVGFSATAVIASTLLTSHYSRDLETKADERGLAFLHAAGWNSEPLGKFFDRLSHKQGADLPALFSTHPPTAVRAAHVSGDGTAALDQPAWAALKAICQ